MVLQGQLVKRHNRPTVDICIDSEQQSQWHSTIEQTRAKTRAVLNGLKRPVIEVDIGAFETPRELKRLMCRVCIGDMLRASDTR